MFLESPRNTLAYTRVGLRLDEAVFPVTFSTAIFFTQSDHSSWRETVSLFSKPLHALALVLNVPIETKEGLSKVASNPPQLSLRFSLDGDKYMLYISSLLIFRSIRGG